MALTQKARFGVRAKILASFAAIIIATLVANGVGIFAFQSLVGGLRQITEETAPSALLAARLGQRANALAAAAPSLLAATDADQRAALQAALREDEEALKRLTSALSDVAAPEIVETVSTTAGRMNANLRIISATSEALDRLRASKAATLDAWATAFAEAETALQSAETDALRRAESVAPVLQRLDIPRFRAIAELRRLRAELVETVNAIATTTDRTALAERVSAGKAAQEALARAAGTDAAFDAALALDIDALGEQRRELLLADLMGASAAEQNRTLARALNEAVSRALDAAQADIATQAAVSEERADFSIALLVILAVAVVAIGVGVGFFYVARSVMQRVVDLADAMRAMASGDLQVDAPTGGNDEVSEMADALVYFRDKTVEAQELSERASQDRAQAREERRRFVLTMADNFEAEVLEVASTVSKAVADLQNTSTRLLNTTDATRDQAAAADEAAGEASANVNTVAAAAEQLSASIAEITGQVQRSAQTAASARQDAEKTTQTVQGLANAASKIGDIVKLINDIAEQTNLLALNATIEAARAGEAGRGFAVVANEVKSLATQTGRATEEIAGQIQAMRSVVAEAVSDIETVGATIRDIDSTAGVIAEQVAAQSTATEEIVQAISRAARGTQDVSHNISGLSAQAKEGGLVADDTKTAATALSEQSERLNVQVELFLETIRAS